MSGRQPLAIVVARARNGVIGRDNDLPWNYPEDLRHFRAVTLDHAIILGRKTFESIGKPLPRRRMIVLTHRPEKVPEGIETAGSLEQAIALARETDPEPRIVGGEAVFREALPLATTLHLTEIDREVEGDTWFPVFDESGWDEVERRQGDAPELVFRKLERS